MREPSELPMFVDITESGYKKLFVLLPTIKTWKIKEQAKMISFH